MPHSRPPVGTPHGRFLPVVTRPGGRASEKGVILPRNVPPDLTGTVAGTVSRKRLVVSWAGGVPSTIGAGLTWRIPYDPLDDSSLTFTLNRAFLRIETVQTSSVQVQVETAPGGQVSFSATTFDTLTVPAASYEDDNSGLSASISSGALIRISFVAGPGTALKFQVQVSGVTAS